MNIFIWCFHICHLDFEKAITLNFLFHIDLLRLKAINFRENTFRKSNLILRHFNFENVLMLFERETRIFKVCEEKEVGQDHEG